MIIRFFKLWDIDPIIFFFIYIFLNPEVGLENLFSVSDDLSEQPSIMQLFSVIFLSDLGDNWGKWPFRRNWFLGAFFLILRLSRFKDALTICFDSILKGPGSAKLTYPFRSFMNGLAIRGWISMELTPPTWSAKNLKSFLIFLSDLNDVYEA